MVLQVVAGTDGVYALAKKYKLKTAFGSDLLFSEKLATRLVDGNPIENIGLIEDPAKNFLVIMKDGKIYNNALTR